MMGADPDRSVEDRNRAPDTRGGGDVEKWSSAQAAWQAPRVRGAGSPAGEHQGGSESGAGLAGGGGGRQDGVVGVPGGMRGGMSHRAGGGCRVRDGAGVFRAASAVRTDAGSP